jgi:hypothetical protein
MTYFVVLVSWMIIVNIYKKNYDIHFFFVSYLLFIHLQLYIHIYIFFKTAKIKLLEKTLKPIKKEKP